jgi:subtilisin family serine protease
MKRLIVLLLLTLPLAAEPRRFIVEFTSARSNGAKRLRTEAAEMAQVRREFSRAFNGAAVELQDGQSAEALARLPYVAAVYPDSAVIAFSDDAPARHPRRRVASNAGGDGIVVAVIDTGIDGTHPALAGKVIGGYDFVNDDTNPMDDHRHGTHVAGIIAAQSGEMTGIAPGVRLLAYKVLNHEGRGLTSDVIAALERALDPNGDGDSSDRADVANLSLGDRGRPDDPLSRAVDNAVAAGMVVCVAAGNDETFHRIGSPAGAARAITVGASTTEEGVETVAYFSSRGPATQNGAIKPDLVAPGRDIRSTGLNHEYIVLTGTSMATPHVAGLAALLLEEHPDWTPDRVKAALVTTARAVADEEVMTQGTGIADLARARANVIVASPTQLNFGLDGGGAATWSATRRISVRNDGATTRTIRASIGNSSAVVFEIVPSEFTLAAGEIAQVDVTIHVDHATLGKPQTRSFAFSGVLALEWNGDSVRLPWAFLRAGRATIASEGAIAQLTWASDIPRPASAANLGAGRYELLLEPGVFDFVIAASDANSVRVVIAEQQRVEGEVAIAATAAQAPHEIRMAGADERGTPFPDGDDVTTLRSSLVRLVVPHDRSMALPALPGRTLYTSSFSDRYELLATEGFVDAAASRVYVVQYEPLRGVTASRVLQVTPGEYASQELELHFPPNGERREVGIMPRDWPRRPNEFGPQPPSLRFAADAASWKGTLYLTRETHHDFASGAQFALYTAGDPNFPATIITPMLRRDDEGFFATRGFVEVPLPVRAVAGETFAFGHGATHMPGLIHASATGIFGEAEIYGARGERRRNDTLKTKVRVLDESGAEIGSGSVAGSSFFLPLERTGRFRAELKAGPFPFDDRTGEAMQTTRFDTTHGPASPPALTSFAILDGAGRHVTRLPVNGNGTLMFSAADHEQSMYQRVAGAEVFFRRRGTNTWVQLTAVATGEQAATELGVVYRVDLRDALRLGVGEYELAVEIADVQGNTTWWQIAPAFIAEVKPLGRRRAVGK